MTFQKFMFNKIFQKFIMHIVFIYINMYPLRYAIMNYTDIHGNLFHSIFFVDNVNIVKYC